MQTEAPFGYNKEIRVQYVEIPSGTGKSNITVYNNKGNAVTIEFKDSSTKEPIKDVHFRVDNKDGKTVGFYTTSEYGNAELFGVNEGEYRVEILTLPFGYLRPETEMKLSIKTHTDNSTKTNEPLEMENPRLRRGFRLS